MATKKIGRRGFGQVEPNHLSGIVTGQILAQLPVNKTAMGEYIEQGRFAKYDYAKGEVNLTGPGEWMLIYNEEQKYDERLQSHKDYVMKSEDFIDGVMVPRLISTVLGDVYTTNTFGMTDGKNTKLSAPTTDKEFDVEGIELDDADTTQVLAVDKTTGYLVLATDPNADASGPQFSVVKIYTMADGQPGVKLMRIA